MSHWIFWCALAIHFAAVWIVHIGASFSPWWFFLAWKLNFLLFTIVLDPLSLWKLRYFPRVVNRYFLSKGPFILYWVGLSSVLYFTIQIWFSNITFIILGRTVDVNKVIFLKGVLTCFLNLLLVLFNQLLVVWNGRISLINLLSDVFSGLGDAFLSFEKCNLRFSMVFKYLGTYGELLIIIHFRHLNLVFIRWGTARQWSFLGWRFHFHISLCVL